MFRRSSLIIVAALAVLFTSRAVAQSSFGTIVGRVVDQSDAVVPNAPVEVKDTATGVISRTVTQGDGNYVVINLVPGPYEVSVTLKGFKKTIAIGTLVANQRLEMNLTLLAGNVTETVQVSATGQLLDTQSAAITTFINSQQISDLPLSSRNFSQLLVLSPATLATGQTFGGMGSFVGGDQSTYRSHLSGGETFVGGNQGSSNQYLIDGVDDNDPSFQTPTITPSIDAISGIRLMNKNYPAAYGGSASQINIATKSGTNQYHGTLYEFFRNDFLDATNFYSVRDPISGRVKPVLRYNQFGGSLGGPITIPKIINGHDRLFFFFNYEGTRSHSVSSGFGLYPTPAELNGDFSADPTIYNPATGQPFPNNQIPTTDFNSTAAKIIQMGAFPTPNVTNNAQYNYAKRLTNPDDIDQYLARVDAHISSHDSLFVRWAASSQSIATPSLDAFGSSTYKQQGKNLAVSYTHIFSPNLVNEFRAGLNRPIALSQSDSAFGPDLAGSLFKGVDTAPATYGFPYMTFANFAIGAPPNAPLDYYTTDSSLADNLTFIRGAHTLEVGAAVRKLFFKEINATVPRGNLGFSGIFTSGPSNSSGNSIADFLLGLPQNASVNQGNNTAWYNSHGWAFFGQDHWKVTPRLTLDLGVRYEYLAPFQEEHNNVSNVDFSFPGGRYVTPNAAAAAAANSPLIGVIKSRNIVQPDRNNFSPRFGFAFQAHPHTIVRGGYGIFYNTLEYNEYFFPTLNAPFQKSAAVANSPVDYPNNVTDTMDQLFPIASTPAPIPGGSVAYSLGTNDRTPYVQNWNLNVEQQIGSTAVLEMGYIGSESTHTQYRSLPDQGIITTPGGVPTVTFPYPNFLLIIQTIAGQSSNYNAGYVRFTKRFDRGFSLEGNYTWSKAMGISSAPGLLGTFQGFPQNSHDPLGDYGALSFDATNNFVLSGIWQLPFGRNASFANKLPSGLNYIVAGWQLNGIYSARSGFPFGIVALDFSGTISGNPRANQVGNPHAKDPQDPTLAFNRSAFAQPDFYTFGDSRSDALRGKGLSNLDISLFKNNQINERLNVQLRLESFNALNKAQIGPFPGFVEYQSNFGVYQGLQHDARILQLAAKIIF